MKTKEQQLASLLKKMNELSQSGHKMQARMNALEKRLGEFDYLTLCHLERHMNHASQMIGLGVDLFASARKDR